VSVTSRKFTRLGKDTLIYGLGSVANQIISLLLLPVYAHVFSTSNYGVIDITGTVLSLMTTLLTSSIVGTALSYYFYGTEDEADRRLTVTMNLLYVVSANILIGVVGWVFVANISDLLFHSPDYVIYLKLMILTLPFSVVNVLNANLFRLRFKPWSYFAITTSDVLLSMIMNIILVVVLRVGLIGVYVTDLVTTALLAIVGVWMNRMLFDRVISWRRLIDLFAYGLPLMPAGAALWIINYLDRWFLSYYSGLTEVGLYGIGNRIGGAVALFTAAFRLANSPHQFAAAREETAGRFYADTLKYYLLMTCFLGLGTSIFGRELIEILTPQNYWSAYPAVPFYAFSLIAYGLYQLVGVGLLLAKKTHIMGITIVIASLAHIVLLWIFVPVWGFIGAGFATLVTEVGVVIALYIAAQRVYPIPYRLRDVIWIALVTTGLVTTGVLLDLPSLPIQVIVKIGIMLAYPLVLMFVAATNMRELRSILALALSMLPAGFNRWIKRHVGPSSTGLEENP
jgi:O-antigen/teichoic acid export membrane protein